MQFNPDFEGIVLAGVHAWRDGAFEASEARPLVPLAGKPLLCHALAWLRDHGAVRATICANSESPAVRRQLGDGSSIGLELDYYEDWLPRGTAGCIHDAALRARAQRLVIVDGTLVPQLNLRGMLDQHIARGAALTLAVEAAPSGELQPVGIHVAESSVAGLVSAVGYQDLKEAAIPLLHQANLRIDPFLVDTPSARVSDAWSYLEAHSWLLEQQQHEPPADSAYRPFGSGWIHESAYVDPLARFIGPVMIGARSQVEANVMLVGPVSIGADCRIEQSALVSRSAMWNRCRVGRSARVDRSLLVHDAAIASGQSLCNAVVAPAERETWFGRRNARRAAARSQDTTGPSPAALPVRA